MSKILSRIGMKKGELLERKIGENKQNRQSLVLKYVTS